MLVLSITMNLKFNKYLNRMNNLTKVLRRSSHCKILGKNCYGRLLQSQMSQYKNQSKGIYYIPRQYFSSDGDGGDGGDGGDDADSGDSWFSAGLGSFFGSRE